MSQVDVISGSDRRRRWSAEQKRSIVTAAFAPGAVVSEVARRVDVRANQIYRWRRDLRSAENGFVEVVALPGSATGEVAIEVIFSGGSQVRIFAEAPPDLAAAVVSALTSR